MKIGEYDTNLEERTFLNRQLGMRVYTIHQVSNDDDDDRIVTFTT
jgi:hypothetical protein